MNKYYWLIPILPLLGSAFNGLLGKRAGKGATTVVVGLGGSGCTDGGRGMVEAADVADTGYLCDRCAP